jgi:hypothetical protein
MPRVLVLLEDDPRRAAAMIEVVQSALRLPVVQHDNAPDMVEWLEANLDGAVLIALDHDLGPSRSRDGQRFEPGIGRAVADFLAERSPTCPVVIHSSNAPAAEGMRICLEAGGWAVTRVYPFDDLAWMERDWLPEVQRLVGEQGSEAIDGVA